MATILVAEDGDDAAEVLVKALRRAGHRVLSVPDGREALAVLLLAGVDLLVLDLQMPLMDGRSLLAALRSHPRYQSLPVIVFSAYAEGRQAEQLMDAGAAEVLTKGRDGPAQLVTAVERHLPRRPPGDRDDRKAGSGS